MPHKHPDTLRWGGPGAAHEDRSETPPSRTKRPPRGAPTNPPMSQVSGGGGERDRRHGHDPGDKRDFELSHERPRKG